MDPNEQRKLYMQMYAPEKEEVKQPEPKHEYDDDLNEREDFQMSYKPGNTKNMG